MRFQLTAVQEELRAEVRSFAREEIAPVAARYDYEETYPADILDGLGEHGYAGWMRPTNCRWRKSMRPRRRRR